MPWITSNRNSQCVECEGDISEGDEIFYNDYKAFCRECGNEIFPKNIFSTRLENK